MLGRSSTGVDVNLWKRALSGLNCAIETWEPVLPHRKPRFHWEDDVMNVYTVDFNSVLLLRRQEIFVGHFKCVLCHKRIAEKHYWLMCPWTEHWFCVCHPKSDLIWQWRCIEDLLEKMTSAVSILVLTSLPLVKSYNECKHLGHRIHEDMLTQVNRPKMKKRYTI